MTNSILQKLNFFLIEGLTFFQFFLFSFYFLPPFPTLSPWHHLPHPPEATTPCCCRQCVDHREPTSADAVTTLKPPSTTIPLFSNLETTNTVSQIRKKSHLSLARTSPPPTTTNHVGTEFRIHHSITARHSDPNQMPSPKNRAASVSTAQPAPPSRATSSPLTFVFYSKTP